ncbi:MAG: ABC transporter [Ponticaulis sp.]|nr:ABC transporter [Ponticaulis sp.]|tara:strand:+ start:2295 stop:3341 length:1047 start_codon:yes stop_codon:yes gene_type:complete
MTLILENISHAYGRTETLQSLSLSVDAGEVVTLLGPSGCGKTTLLRLVAGLERVAEGRILLDNETLATPDFHPAPEKRPVGLVFQEHALFPNMSVADNIEFGLSNTPRGEREKRRKSLLDMVGLQGLDDRMPGTLSGGQQQRVALARALAPAPAVMLLDEPYASVDVILRRSLRESARLLLKEAGSATILVTHDPDEALEMSDRIAIMSDGVISQADRPDIVVNKPVNAGVASLFGEAQSFDGKIQDDHFVMSSGRLKLGELKSDIAPGVASELVLRPAGAAFEARDDGDWVVRDVRYRSNGRVLFLSPTESGQRDLVRVDLAGGDIPEPGKRGQISLRAEHAFLFAK